MRGSVGVGASPHETHFEAAPPSVNLGCAMIKPFGSNRKLTEFKGVTVVPCAALWWVGNSNY